MNKLNLIIYIAVSVFLVSCSEKVKEKSVINEKSLELQVLESYSEGLKELEDGYVLMAAKKFNEVEILFPQSKWAPKSSIMAAYSYYSKDYYDDAISELIRFIRVYPNNQNIDYAYYLIGMCYYEKIVDEKKDLESIIKAKDYFQIIMTKYPNTEYALDLKFKLDLINNQLAAKELFIAKYYIETQKWIAAINRLKTIVEIYSETIFIEELELSVRAYNCLKRANIHTLNDLLQYSADDLLEFKNFGQKSADEVCERVKLKFDKDLHKKHL